MSTVICITGCTKGLGRALVDGFIAEGATVAGCGRDLEALEALTELYPGKHLFRVCNVANDTRVRIFADDVLQGVGVPDILINNAGVINRNAPLWQVPETEFSKVVDVNIKGVTSFIRAFVPAMIEKGSGIIVNLSSGWGRSTSPEVAPYCATKWAIEGLSQALAQELPAGLTAVALNPGVIDTQMLRSCFGDSATGHQTPEEWAKRAVPYILGIKPTDSGRPLTVA